MHNVGRYESTNLNEFAIIAFMATAIKFSCRCHNWRNLVHNEIIVGSRAVITEAFNSVFMLE